MLIGSEIVPRIENLITTIPRYFKEYTVEVEVMLTGLNRDSWTNLLGFTISDGGTTNPGDRIPIISVHPSKYRLQIDAYVSGNNNYDAVF